jgi:lactoylglutathione lyase
MDAFPILYCHTVGETAAFYGQLGFVETYRFPAEGEAGYVTLERDGSRLGLVDAAWPEEQFSLRRGDGPRGELFVYVQAVDEVVARLGAPVLRAPEDRPWGERVAHVADPEGNPVALAQRAP